MRKPFVNTTRALSADALTPPIHFPRATDRGLSALAMLAARIAFTWLRPKSLAGDNPASR